MQMNTPQRVTVVAALLLASVIIVHAAILDGTKWKVKAVPDKATAEKGGKEFEDEWVFADGKFTSTAMAREGFNSATYALETEPGEIEFEIEQSKAVKATNDVVVWTATLKGTNATGGLLWKKKVNGDFLYEITGTKE